MYADDIILTVPSVGALQKLLHKCEQKLCWLGMSVNVKKSCCLRVGQRCDVACANITTSSGEQLPWVKELRYLGVYLVQLRHFRCTIHEHKKSFFRSVNAILGKVGRTAPEKVTLQLVFFEMHTCVIVWFRNYAFT